MRLAKQWIIPAVAVFATASVFTACDSDDSPGTGATLKEENGVIVSSFGFDASTWGLADGMDAKVEFVLVSEESDSVLSYPATIRVNGSRAECSITLPSSHTRPSNGDYTVYLFTTAGVREGRTIRVGMRDRMIERAWEGPMLYKPMGGHGTPESPYLITGQSDMMALIAALDDEKGIHGRGLYYRQTQDFDVPPRSNMTTGRGYYSAPFAGNYDGDNHRLSNLSYTGAMNSDKDVNIGLFSKLLSGAVVSDLTLEGFDISEVATSGALAGMSSGNVVLKNISATGNISGGNNLGGLIGVATDTLTVEGYSLNMTISGRECVGGVVGNSVYTTLTVKDLSTEKHRFRLTASNYCGGVAGSASGAVDIESVSLDHSVQSTDKDVTIITVNDGSCAGGLFGHLTVTRPSKFKDIEILAPIAAPTSAGGVVGMASIESELAIDGCVMSTVVSGKKETGGIFGKCMATTAASVKFTGKESRIMTDLNAGEINGGEYTGGIAGMYYGKSLSFDAPVRMEMNVKATGNDTGGLFGYLGITLGAQGYLDCDLTNIRMESNTMDVLSDGDFTGGLIGSAYKVNLFRPMADGRDLIVDGPKLGTVPSPVFSGIVDGGDYSGGLVGKAQECNISGLNFNGTVSGKNIVGGIVGEFMMVESPYGLKNCITSDKAMVEGTGDKVGGIAGEVSSMQTLGKPGSVYSVINKGYVRGGQMTGGIIGSIVYGDCDITVSWAANAGTVAAKGVGGGILGHGSGGGHTLLIENSVNFAKISVNGPKQGDAGGGIVGGTWSNRSRIEGCANHGTVDGSGEARAIGGIAGHLGRDPGGVTQSENVRVYSCMNSGEVKSSQWHANLGGLVGYQEEGSQHGSDEWCVSNSYNAGPVTSDQDSDNGGLVGKVSHYSKILRCVNYGKVSYGNACIGTRQSSAIVYHDYLYYLEGTGKDWYSTNSISSKDLGNKDCYRTFDFNNVWTLDGRSRPELRHCPWQYATGL